MSKKLIVGLGNPGTQYDDTRHNIGFAILNAFGEKYKIKGNEDKDLLCWCGKGTLQINDIEHESFLAWPTTYMNNSGDAVLRLINWFKLEVDDLIVVHDEVALDLGKIRIGFNNGSAGHHGIESIIQNLNGNQAFIRIRIGVGPDPGGDKRRDYVLEKFTKNDNAIVEKVIQVSVEALETLMVEDVNFAMNKYNGMEVTT